ncbi:MAG: hypothetical protein U1E28_21960 [Beijerinckiaceae bacterium]
MQIETIKIAAGSEERLCASEAAPSVMQLYALWLQSKARKDRIRDKVDEVCKHNPDPAPPRALRVKKSDKELVAFVYDGKALRPGGATAATHWPAPMLRNLATGRAWPPKHEAIRDRLRARAEEIVAAHEAWIEKLERHWQRIGVTELERKEEAETRRGQSIRAEIAVAPAQSMGDLLVKLEVMAFCIADSAEDAERELTILRASDDAGTAEGLTAGLVRDFYLGKTAGWLRWPQGA